MSPSVTVIVHGQCHEEADVLTAVRYSRLNAGPAIQDVHHSLQPAEVCVARGCVTLMCLPVAMQLVINTVNPANAATTLKVIKVCASYIYVIDQVSASFPTPPMGVLPLTLSVGMIAHQAA